MTLNVPLLQDFGATQHGQRAAILSSALALAGGASSNTVKSSF
jgi:hypothetical protein